MLESRDQLLGRVAKRALVTPVSLGLLSATALCALLPATWPVMALGIVAEAVTLQLLIRDPHFVRAVREECQQAQWHHQAARIAQVRQSVDSETGAMLDRIHVLQERLLQIDGDAEIQPPDGGAPRGQVAGLMDRCLHLAMKRHQLRGYLAAGLPAELQQQASRLEVKLEGASDPVERQLYVQALDQKRGELESYCAIQHAVRRIDAQFQTIECSFGNLLGRLIRLNSADDAHAALIHHQISRDLSELGAHLDALESSVKEMLVIEARP